MSATAGKLVDSSEEGSYPSRSMAGRMSNLKTELEHIKHHIKYPANKTQVMAACNNMSDVPSIDKDFVAKSLPDSNYKGPEDVVKALLNKVYASSNFSLFSLAPVYRPPNSFE